MTSTPNSKVTNEVASKMIAMLCSRDREIKSKDRNENQTSCNYFELLDLSGIDKDLFGKYRRSLTGKNFLLSSGVEISNDNKNPKISVDNTKLKVKHVFSNFYSKI